MIGELNSYRARHKIAAQLLEEHCATSRWSRRNLETLRSSYDSAGPPASAESMPLPEEVLSLLLESRQMDPPNALRMFWRLPEQVFTVAQGNRPPDLAARLRAHTSRVCGEFSEWDMNDILALMGGTEALQHPFLVDTMNRLTTESAPWIPVQGKSLKTVAAVPKSVTPHLRDAILEHLGKPAACIETSREALMVVQWTQGYAAEISRSADWL
jgi:hypothetical protein